MNLSYFSFGKVGKGRGQLSLLVPLWEYGNGNQWRISFLRQSDRKGSLEGTSGTRWEARNHIWLQIAWTGFDRPRLARLSLNWSSASNGQLKSLIVLMASES